MRFQEWVKTDNFIKNFTSDLYSLQHNQFSDWTQAERNAILDEKIDQTPFKITEPGQNSKLASRTYSPNQIDGTAPPVMQQTFPAIVSATSCPQNCSACNIACTACQPTYTLQSNGVCSCNSGQVLTATGQCANAITCTIGFTNVQNKCVACPKFCFACTNIGGICTQCSIASMQIVNVTDSNPCLNCDPQFQQTAVGQCRCRPNTFLNGTVCSPLNTCPLSNQFNTGSTQVCQNCPTGCATCNNFSGWCIKTTDPSVLINSTTGVPYCPTGQIMLKEKCVALILCPVAQYNDGQNNCFNCSKNCSSCANVTGICTQCAPTFTLNSTSNICGCLPSTQFLDLDTSTNTGNCVTIISCGNSKYNPGYNNCTNCSFGCQVCPMGVCNSCLPTFTQSGTTCACNPDTAVQFYNTTSNQCVNIASCPSGQYNGGTNNCINCASNCSACAFKTGVCSSCVSTYTFNSVQKTCSCVAGQYWTSSGTGGTCQTCPATCVNCQDLTSSCTSCPNNLVLITANNPVTCGCSTGTYLKSGSCVACPNNCTACTDGTGACTACANTYALASGACTCTGSQGVISGLCADLIPCPDGQYNNGQQQCVNGPANCLKVTPVSGICSQCQPTFTFVASVNMCSCVTGQFLNSSNQCQACPQNCTRCSPSTGAQAACTVCQPTFTFTQATWSCACTLTPTQQAFVSSSSCAAMITCPQAQYNDGTNTCRKCSSITPNCGVCSVNTGQCTACLDTFYSNTTSGSLACECLPGQYLTTKGACAVCPLNCTACDDLTGRCTSCAPTFTLANGVCSCVENSQLLLSDQCVDYAVCTSTQYPNNQNVCTDCAQYCTTCANVTGYCLTCQSGYVTTAANICAAKTNCGAGKYNDGHNVCNNCPAAFCTTCADDTGSCTSCNTIPLVTGQCVCSTGQYRATGSTCQTCGTHCTSCADTTGYCTTCENTFTNNVGSTGVCGCDITIGQAFNGTLCDTLKSCSNGYYNPNDGTNTCLKCPTANCAKCDSTGYCTSCNATFIFNTGIAKNAANACVCPTSYYKMLSGLCNKCPANCSACADSTGSCTTCSDTTFGSPVGGACVCPSTTPAFTGGKCYAMTDCGAGKWNDGTNTCQSCPTNCASCSDWTGICSTCSTSFTLNSVSNTCTCLSSQYLSNTNSQCANCPANCTTCSDGTGSCLTCNPSFSPPANGVCLCPSTLAFANSQCVAMTTCTPGNYNDGTNTCQACPLHCQNCSDWTGLCTTCNSTFLAPTAQNTCGCTTGYYATSSHVCTKCSAHCSACNDITGECTQCSDASFTIVAGFCTCSATQYLTSTNICRSCPTNCTSCQDLTATCDTCVSTFQVDSLGGCSCQGATKALVAGACVAMTTCAAKKYNDGTNTCQFCPSKCDVCDDFTGTCTQCASTYTNNNPTANTCTCTSSQYLDSTSNCVSCPTNCTTCADSTGYCTGCQATFTLGSNACGCNPTNEALVTSNGVQQCVALSTCPSAQYNPGNNVCQKCPSGCAACSAYLGVCSRCLTTYTTQADKSCVCASNQYINSTGFCQNCHSNCTTCTDNTGACTACATSFLGPTSGVCSCETGKIIIKATGLCTTKVSCPAGKYNDGQNNCVFCSSNCTACNDFTGGCTACVASFTLNTTLSNCSCGSTQAFQTNKTTGVISCQSPIRCKAGQYNPGTNICQQCPQNCSSCVDGNGTCTTCLQGFILDTPKKGSCGCKSNQAFVNGLCTAQIACTKAGQYNPGNNICTNCPQNCTACSTPSGLCTSCATTFTISMSKGSCTCTSSQAFVAGKCTTLNTCPAGQYNLGNNICSSCSSQCTSCVDFTGRCTQCNSGYTVSSGSCVAASRRILKNDTNCVYAVGPVGQAQICLAQSASESRVVPEFSQTDQSIDWRVWDVVNDVKDLGKCVGDFASSASAAAASAYAIKTGKLFYLSEQYLIDCDVGSFGCRGGNKTSSTLLLATKGAVLDNDYPYVGQQTGCRGDSVQKVFQLQYPGYQEITTSKEAFKTQLRKGPLNVSFRISSMSFFFYGNGILTKDACETGKLNHAMLAVGFGVENNIEYALIQNSWGKSWGEQGLFRVELSDDSEGPCGLYLQSFYTLV